MKRVNDKQHLSEPVRVGCLGPGIDTTAVLDNMSDEDLTRYLTKRWRLGRCLQLHPLAGDTPLSYDDPCST